MRDVIEVLGALFILGAPLVLALALLILFEGNDGKQRFVIHGGRLRTRKSMARERREATKRAMFLQRYGDPRLIAPAEVITDPDRAEMLGLGAAFRQMQKHRP